MPDDASPGRVRRSTRPPMSDLPPEHADDPDPDPAVAPEPRTLVISDLHLGQPGRAPDADRFAKLVAGFARVIVNGDAAEVQVPHLRAGAARELDRFRGIVEAAGAELVLITGNHDAFVSERRRMTLLGGRVFLTHGDVLDPAVAPWSDGAAGMRRDTARRLAAWEAAHGAAPDADARLEIARHVSHHEFLQLRPGGVSSPLRRLAAWSLRPGRFFTVLNYWRTVPARAAAFARAAEPGARVVVFGHSHRAGSWRERGCHVFNTGAFTWPGKPHGVVIDGHRVTFHAIHNTPGGFVLDAEPIAGHETR